MPIQLVVARVEFATVIVVSKVGGAAAKREVTVKPAEVNTGADAIVVNALDCLNIGLKGTGSSGIGGANAGEKLGRGGGGHTCALNESGMEITITIHKKIIILNIFFVFMR